jgi:hypothetical protein
MAACVVLDALLIQEGRAALAGRIQPSLTIPAAMSGVYKETPKVASSEGVGEKAAKVGDE